MKWVVVSAALLGLASVIMGAAGDHMLEGRLTAQATEQISVALRYHQLYSIVLLCVGLYGLTQERQKFLMAICLTFLAGILIFSFSLYLSVFLSLPILTFGTPVGGILLMAGWGLTAFYAARLPKKQQ
jgi:uncharacterized membrane protein YgdD (TMEM256/DUF423 family)